jgi:hypothetical protein
MKNLFLSLAFSFGAFLNPSIAFSAGECDIAKEAIQKASVIRNLKIKAPVPCQVHSKEEVKQFILNTVNTKIPPEKLAMEEVAFKALGLVPEEFPYAQGVVDLYVSQLGGYYDPEKKYFVMAGWLPAMMQPTIAAHELTHALQDQYYNLSSFLDPKADNSDAQLARSALVEGDATAVMMDYMRGLAGQPGISTEKDMNSFMLQNVMGMSLTAGLKNVPQSLQHMLIFPYTSGLRFVHSLLMEKGYPAVDQAFKRPPRSTEEILHPELYSSSPSFITFTDDETRREELPEGAFIRYRDTLGEFLVSVLLEMYLPEKLKATTGSAGWGGDRIAIGDDAASGLRYVVWKTHWDSQKDAEEFFSLMIDSLKMRFPKNTIVGDRATWNDLGNKKSLKIHRHADYVTFSMRQPIAK